MLTLSRENYFRYRECSERRCSLEADFKKKARLWLDIYFVKHVLEFLTLIYVRIKSDAITLENYGSIVDDILISMTCRPI